MSETALISATSSLDTPSVVTSVPKSTVASATPSATKMFKSDKQTKLSTSIQFDISNKTALADLSKRYNPPQPPSESSVPQKKSTYFEKLDVATRLDLDHGISHIIDVQPDLRFPLQYFMYNITEEYPELNVKAHPFVSTFTLIAYQQIMLNAYLLICDLHARENISYFTQDYKNDTLKSDFLSGLMSSYVPPDLEILINNLAPTYDPQRRLQSYVPSLAGFDFLLDFGRIVPPSMFLLAPHLLASTRSNADPETVLHQFYSTQIATVNNLPLYPSHFLGGYFDRLQRPTFHSNWLNSRFENIFNPVIGKALAQRPTLAKTKLEPPVFQDPAQINPYDLLLCYSEDNLDKLLEI